MYTLLSSLSIVLFIISTVSFRPLTDPVIVHVPLSRLGLEQLYDFSGSEAHGERIVRGLAQDFWPGPLTIIFRAHASVPSCVTASSGYVGVRSPRHSTAQRLLELSGVPVAAPSANRFGHVSPTSAGHVMDDLGEEEVFVLEDGEEKCEVGIESTVCRVSGSGDAVTILRCGAVTSEQITASISKRGVTECTFSVDNERAVKKSASLPTEEPSVAPGTALSSPSPRPLSIRRNWMRLGQMIKHYAPDVPIFVYLSCPGKSEDIASEFLYALADVSVSRMIVVDFGAQLSSFQSSCWRYIDLSATGNAAEACTGVFSTLWQVELWKKENPEEVHLLLLPD